MDNDKIKKIAIYSRKSKYSDKSESIDSQIEICKSYSKSRYRQNIDFSIYIDEGFSGGSTKRPQYKKLLLDIKNNSFDILMCYKIDRLSRSFIDFANLQQIIMQYKVDIISASEGFDTTTPWGTSVLNILMIFAQLERTNVSERIKDTMIYYAKQGRWTGGLTPTGFKSKIVNYNDSIGHLKKMTVLYPVENEIELVKIIYKKYIELQSLNSVEKWLLKNNYTSKKNKYFSSATIKEILTNPVYACADIDIYNFFNSYGCNIYNSKEEFNGMYSLISYNKNNKKTHKKYSYDKWIISISSHKWIVSSKDWIDTQNILKSNSKVTARTGTGMYGLFSGIIICENCKSLMRVKKGRIKKATGIQEFYYICSLKEKSKKCKCNIKNLIGTDIEKIIINYIQSFLQSLKLFETPLDKKDIIYSKTSDINLIKNLNKELKSKQQNIENLVYQLSQTNNAITGKYIDNQIKILHCDIKQIQENIEILSYKENKSYIQTDIEILKQSISDITFINKIDNHNIKRKLINSIIKSILWNGNTLTINFNI